MGKPLMSVVFGMPELNAVVGTFAINDVDVVLRILNAEFAP